MPPRDDDNDQDAAAGREPTEREESQEMMSPSDVAFL